MKVNKIIILTLSLLLLFLHQGINAQDGCGTTGAPEITPPTDSACQDGNYSDNLVIKQFSSSSFTDYKIIVTAPSAPFYNADGTPYNDANGNQISGEEIIGVSSDGSFDFTDDGTGNPYPLGNYQFTIFAYNQTDLDAFVQEINPFLEPNFMLPPLDLPADLEQMFNTIPQILGVVLTIVDVEDAICNIVPLLINTSLPYSIGSVDNSGSYTVSLSNSANCILPPSCLIEGGAPEPISPLMDNFLAYDNTTQTATAPAITAWGSQPDVFSDYVVIVSRDDNDETIGYSDDGSFTFSVEEHGTDSYNFTIFAYNQSDLDRSVESINTNINPTPPLAIPADIKKVIPFLQDEFSTTVFEAIFCEELFSAAETFMSYAVSNAYTLNLDIIESIGNTPPSSSMMTLTKLDQILQVSFTNTNFYPKQLAVYDISGKKIAEQRIAGTLVEVPLTNYKKGIYILQVNDDKQTVHQKFIVQ